MKFFIYLLLFVFVSVSQSRLFEGQCRPRPSSIVTSFDFNAYLGVWYELEWYDDEYPTDDECIKFTYTEKEQNSINILLESRHANESFKYESFKGHGLLSFPNNLDLPAQFNTTYGKGVPKRVNYQILATDYTKFSFVWDCHNVNGTHYNEKFWYLARDAHLSDRPKVVDDLLNKYFDQQFIRETYQGPECLNTNPRMMVVNVP